MITLLLMCAAQAAWLPLGPQEPVEGALLLEQGSGQRLLFTVSPADAELTVLSEGAWLPLQAGPQGSLVLPAPQLTREVQLQSSGTVTAWRESLAPVQVAWDRYEEALARWALHGGALPSPPAPIYELEQEWVLRRQAFVAVGEPVHEVLLASMLLELEAHRALSGRDHPALILPTVQLMDADLEAGQPSVRPSGQVPSERHELTLQGPGVLVVDVQVWLQEDPYLDFVIQGSLDGRPTVRRGTVAGQDPENPAMGWSRRVEIVVPPGEHEVSLQVHGASAQLTPTWRARRSGWRRSALLRRYADPTRPRGPLESMERHVVLRDPRAMDQARALLADTSLTEPVYRLARLRLVRWSGSDQEALELQGAHPDDPLLLAALARRWQGGAELDVALFLEQPRALPMDPQLLAELAAALGGPFIRPRGEAILRLGEGDLRGWDASRWSALRATSQGGEVLRTQQSPGIPRILVEPGPAARLELPQTDPGTVPVLRLQATEPVRYRVDGRESYGMGRLDEALSPGQHFVEVLQGQLWVLDAEAVVSGGTRYYEREQAPLPARFLIPDAGAPVSLALLPNHPGTLRISANDGAEFEIEVPADAERVVVPLGPWATEVWVRGPEHLAVSALMRHPKGVTVWPTLPDPGVDPVAVLGEASRALVRALQEGVSDAELAALRLQRAGAYQALGLNGSARAEANLVLLLPEATDTQRRQALASLPPSLPVRKPGPQSAEAVLALSQRLPPDSPQDWQRVAEQTTPPAYADLVWTRASERYLEEGDPVGAYHCAEQARAAGTQARRAASLAGQWRGISVVDSGGGLMPYTVTRQGPDSEDGDFAQAREASLGAPWPAEQAAVLRPGRQDVIQWRGAQVDLELLCRDESHALEPASCQLGVAVDQGPEQQIELLDGQLLTLPLVVQGGEHSVALHLSPTAGPALVVHASTPQGPIAPQKTVNAHRVGAGLALTVPGPLLFRVKVHSGGPVQVRVGEQLWPVEQTRVIALTDQGPLDLRVEGPPGALVTFARLEPQDPALAAEERALAEQEALDPESRLPPAAAGPITSATQLWMQEVAVPRHPLQAPMGAQGSFWAGSRVGDDLGLNSDGLDHWRYLQIAAGYRKRGQRPDRFFHGATYARASLDGPPSLGLEGQAHWLPERWVLSAEGQAWGTAGAAHVSLRLRTRYIVELSRRWRVQPWVWLRVGVWSPTGSASVDPRAWTSYGRDHWLGAGLGLHVDYKPFRDLRLRATPSLQSNANGTLDKAGLVLRADWLLSEQWWLTSEVGQERRFVDLHRAQAFWRPSVALGATWGRWVSPTRWWLLDIRLRYLPADQQVQGWVGLRVELAPRRGVYDHVPIDAPFLPQRDLPLEMR